MVFACHESARTLDVFFPAAPEARPALFGHLTVSAFSTSFQAKRPMAGRIMPRKAQSLRLYCSVVHKMSDRVGCLSSFLLRCAKCIHACFTTGSWVVLNLRSMMIYALTPCSWSTGAILYTLDVCVLHVSYIYICTTYLGLTLGHGQA